MPEYGMSIIDQSINNQFIRQVLEKMFVLATSRGPTFLQVSVPVSVPSTIRLHGRRIGCDVMQEAESVTYDMLSSAYTRQNTSISRVMVSTAATVGVVRVRTPKKNSSWGVRHFKKVKGEYQNY